MNRKRNVKGGFLSCLHEMHCKSFTFSCSISSFKSVWSVGNQTVLFAIADEFQWCCATVLGKTSLY